VRYPKFLPHPASWASAVALFVFAIGVSVAYAFVMPILAELMRHSPRLAMIGMLAMWVMPVGAAAGIHRLAGGLIDFADIDRRSGADAKKIARGTSGAASAWAGFVAWATILVVTMTTRFVMLVLDPPPAEPDHAWNVAAVVAQGVSGWVGIFVWIVLAAYVYEIERAARSSASDA